MLRLTLAIWLGRLAGIFSRLVGRGGSALPGLVAERIDPRVVERLAATIPGGIVVVTGTNGKTTTTKMLVTALERSGRPVLTNPTGSNLSRGIATVLIGAARRGRIPGAELAVFEADEAAVRGLASRLRPHLVIVTNLARDQLDRYGELDTTASHVGVAVRVADRAVLNADDPAVAALDAGRTSWFGAVPGIRAQMPHDRVLYGDDGPQEPTVQPDAILDEIEPEGDGQRMLCRVRGASLEALLRVPGAYNGYNALAALLAAADLGLDPADAAGSLGDMPPAFGRGQVIDYGGRRVKLVLVKNPAGFNQAVRLLVDVSTPTPVLFAINDNHADGRDVSWLWDVRFEDLAGTHHRFGVSGIRGADMALRLKYAGVDCWHEPGLDVAVERVVGDAPEGGVVYVIPTYTAMLDVLDGLLPGTSRSEAWV